MFEIKIFASKFFLKKLVKKVKAYLHAFNEVLTYDLWIKKWFYYNNMYSQR